VPVEFLSDEEASAYGVYLGVPSQSDLEKLFFLRPGLKDKGTPVPGIARKLVIKTGKNTGQHPSIASLYRALAEAADSDALAGEAFSFRPVPARITGPGSGTDPELMERLQRQGTSPRD
jgi:hypothetical protein